MADIQYPYWLAYVDCPIGNCYYEHLLGLFRSEQDAQNAIAKYAYLHHQPRQPRPIQINLNEYNKRLVPDPEHTRGIPIVFKDGTRNSDGSFTEKRE